MVGQYDVIFYRHYKSFLILVFKLVHFWLELEQKDVYLKILSRKRGKIETKIEEEHETAKLNVNQNHFNNKVSSWNYFSYLSIGGNSTIYIQVIFRLCMAYSLSPFFFKKCLISLSFCTSFCLVYVSKNFAVINFHFIVRIRVLCLGAYTLILLFCLTMCVCLIQWFCNLYVV